MDPPKPTDDDSKGFLLEGTLLVTVYDGCVRVGNSVCMCSVCVDVCDVRILSSGPTTKSTVGGLSVKGTQELFSDPHCVRALG